ncbi:hypothetical protein D3C71_77350 [compost metagenome]
MHGMLKRRWEMLKDLSDWASVGVDVELETSLRLLNQLPGVVTFMSCAGHPDVVSKSREAQTTLYVSMAITDESHLPLLALTSELQDSMLRWGVEWPRNLSLTYSMRGYVPSGMTREDVVWWRSACLTYKWSLDDWGTRTPFIRQLEATLSNHVKNYQPQNKEPT